MFAGALLEHAEELLRMGLSPTEVIEGYETACQKALEMLPSMFSLVEEGRGGGGAVVPLLLPLEFCAPL